MEIILSNSQFSSWIKHKIPLQKCIIQLTRNWFTWITKYCFIPIEPNHRFTKSIFKRLKQWSYFILLLWEKKITRTLKTIMSKWIYVEDRSVCGRVIQWNACLIEDVCSKWCATDSKYQQQFPLTSPLFCTRHLIHKGLVATNVRTTS